MVRIINVFNTNVYVKDLLLKIFYLYNKVLTLFRILHEIHFTIIVTDVKIN